MYNCDIINALGINNCNMEGRQLRGIDGHFDWVSGRGTRGDGYGYNVNFASGLMGALSRATGRNVIRSGNNPRMNINRSDGWQRLLVGILQDGTEIDYNNDYDLNNLPSPLVDYYMEFDQIVFTYHYLENGFTLYDRYTINLTSPVQIRQYTQFIDVLEAGGLTGLTYTRNTVPTTIRCLDITAGTTQSATITVPAFPLTNAMVTIIDGDPPERTNNNAAHYVQATEPTDTALGDLWFNPIDGQLKIWTN